MSFVVCPFPSPVHHPTPAVSAGCHRRFTVRRPWADLCPGRGRGLGHRRNGEGHLGCGVPGTSGQNVPKKVMNKSKTWVELVWWLNSTHHIHQLSTFPRTFDFPVIFDYCRYNKNNRNLRVYWPNSFILLWRVFFFWFWTIFHPNFPFSELTVRFDPNSTNAEDNVTCLGDLAKLDLGIRYRRAPIEKPRIRTVAQFGDPLSGQPRGGNEDEFSVGISELPTGHQISQAPLRLQGRCVPWRRRSRFFFAPNSRMLHKQQGH